MKYNHRLTLIMTIFLILCSITLFTVLAAPQTIVPGGDWRDNNGNFIQAHGAGMIKVGSTYYWFGEEKGHDKFTFNGISCYSSTDLKNWIFERIALPVGSGDLANTMRVERPKVIFNSSTNTYVMYVHIDNDAYSYARVGVATCGTVNGVYSFRGSFRPLNEESRDMTLFKDTDGTAYLIHSANGNADMHIDRLSSDYLTVASHVVTLFAGQSREAPCMVKKDNLYYLITSGCSGWVPNQGKYATSSSISSGWSGLSNIGDSTTYNSQGAYILTVQGSTATTYIFCGDRWTPASWTDSTGIKNSRYIWLPLNLNGTSASLTWYDSWTIDTVTGAWSAATPTPTPTPLPGTTTVNDTVTGTGNNQFDYAVGTWGYSSDLPACYNGDNHWSNGANNYYLVRFNGTRIKLYGSKASNCGIGAYSIDGGSETNIDLYSASRQDGIVVFDSGTLASGAHTLKARVTGTKNAGASDCYITADRVDIISGSSATATPTPTAAATATPIPGGTKLTGTKFGTTPAWAAGREYDKAFDGNISTYFDYLNANGGYTGIDLGSGNAKRIVKIRYYPRPNDDPNTDECQRMVGGKFQGSNTSTSSGYIDLFTISVKPGWSWTEVTITNSNTFRYLRYLGPDNSYCNVAEVEFYGL